MFCSLDDFGAIASTCQRSKVGKLLPDALYVHVSALPALDPILQDSEQEARQIAAPPEVVTLVKFNTEKPSISYLVYPNFDAEPHPALQASIQVDLRSREVNYRSYSDTGNPFILHRKETFVTTDYPLYQQFATLTRQ